MGQGFGRDYEQGEGVNTTSNPFIHEVDSARRHVLRCTTAAVALLMGSHTLTAGAAKVGKGKPLGFAGVPVSAADALVVSSEYEAQVLYRWGLRARSGRLESGWWNRIVGASSCPATIGGL